MLCHIMFANVWQKKVVETNITDHEHAQSVGHIEFFEFKSKETSYVPTYTVYSLH